MSSNLIIEARNLSKSYIKDTVKIPVLKEISFDVKEGDFIVIKGPSGAGKSTLLNILGVLDTPTSGELLIAGKNMRDLNEGAQARFRNSFVGFVFQFHHLLVEFTALENLYLPAMIKGTEIDIIKEKASDLLDKVGLGERKTHKPRELSGGEQQRVAIARSLMNTPKLILADEPTGNLDSKTSDRIFDLLHELNQVYGQTFIIATHSEKLALSANRVIEIFDGEIVN